MEPLAVERVQSSFFANPKTLSARLCGVRQRLSDAEY